MRALAYLFPAAAMLAFVSACSGDEEPSGQDASTVADAGLAGDGAVQNNDAAANDDAETIADAETFPDASGPSDSGVVLGEPIVVAAPNAWTWVDFPESACDDGSATGIGVSTSSTSSNLMLFFNGGGACWDYLTCFQLMTATRGPFGETQFNQLIGSLNGSVFDRSRPDNIFRDWNMVFIPYCTGDTHAGDNIVTYELNGQMGTFHHVGRKNFQAFVQRLAATFTAPEKLVVSGASAGGFGASWNYDTSRTYWPNSKGYMIDDSGPALKGDAISMSLRDAWLVSWNLGPVLDQLCGVECADDYSLAYLRLAEKYPNDRLSLLSSLQDNVIRSFMNLSGPAFQTALLDMSTTVIDPLESFKYFFITGSSHTMLGSPQQFNSSGTNLWDWMDQQVNDDPSWESTKP